MSTEQISDAAAYAFFQELEKIAGWQRLLPAFLRPAKETASETAEALAKQVSDAVPETGARRAARGKLAKLKQEARKKSTQDTLAQSRQMESDPEIQRLRRLKEQKEATASASTGSQLLQALSAEGGAAGMKALRKRVKADDLEQALKALIAAGKVRRHPDGDLIKMSVATATKTDPAKWEAAKREAKARMGGKHSARAMQLATQIYKKKGGGYSGPKPDAKSNSLKKWTKQKWKWSGGDKPGQGGKGVYLPSKKVERLKGSEEGRKKLRRASAKKSEATREGRQYSSHGLAAGTSLQKKAAAYRPGEYQDEYMLSTILDRLSNMSRDLKGRVDGGTQLPSWAEYKVYKGFDGILSALGSTYSGPHEKKAAISRAKVQKILEAAWEKDPNRVAAMVPRLQRLAKDNPRAFGGWIGDEAAPLGPGDLAHAIQRSVRGRGDTPQVLLKKAEVEYRGVKFPGYNKPIASNRKGKKKMVLVKRGDKIRLVHFGQKGYEDFTQHKDKKRRENYLKRSGGIRGKGGKLTANDPFSANYWARKELW